MHSNWFETFFEGLAVEMWRGAMTPEITAREAGFLAARLELRPEMRVLDVPCGSGRHAIELARLGVKMTGVDLSEAFLKVARGMASDVEWVRSDMRCLPGLVDYDAAYCWGNSFAYFDYENCLRFLRAVASALKPGGRFILDSGAVSESILPTLQTERKLKIGDIDFHSRNNYVAMESRMDITYTFTRGEEQEVKPIHQWVHSAGEICRMFRASGLEPVEAFGDVEGTPYALGSPRFIVLATKV